ncbi:MAG: hypothetical protein ACLSVD_00585 [Eggerthellaceae bacterium]
MNSWLRTPRAAAPLGKVVLTLVDADSPTTVLLAVFKLEAQKIDG